MTWEREGTKIRVESKMGKEWRLSHKTERCVGTLQSRGVRDETDLHIN